MSPAEIKARHNLTGIETLEYISICKSIQKSQQIIRHTRTAGINCIIPEITKSFLACENSKSIYNKLLKTIIERPTAEARLNTLYAIDPEHIEKVYKLPFLVTIETKLRSFQFKFNHLIYYTNKTLFDRKMISDTPLCTFCQTVEH